MATPDQASIREVREDVYAFVLGPDETLCSFLVVDEAPTLVDAATDAAADAILDAVERVGVEPQSLANVVVSHVHLDHSGAAGRLYRAADDLDVYIHESTAHHLVEPGRLVESTKRVLGDEFERMGAPAPLPEAAIVPVTDRGTTIDTGARELSVIHTPGHSPDHLAAHDGAAEIAFANEAIGRYYPEADCWIPPVTRPNFDVEGVYDAIDAIRRLQPAEIGLSHVGTVEPDAAIGRARDRMAAFAEHIPDWFEATGDVDATVERVRAELLSLEGAYPERVVANQAAICTRGILDYSGAL